MESGSPVLDVCIVTPGHLSSNPRVYKEASALSNAGLSVEVIHGSYAPFYEEQDRKLVRTFPTKAVKFGPYVASKRTYLRQTLVRHLARLTARVAYAPFFVARAAISPVARDLAAVACETRARLYIAHYVAALPAVLLASEKHGSRFSFDAEDFHLGELADTPEHAAERRIIRSIERRTLPSSAFLTAASSGISKEYAREYGLEEATIILNVFSRTNAPASPTKSGDTYPRPSLYWFSQTIGPGRGLETAIRGVCETRCEAHLYLRGAISVSYRENLQSIAAASGGGGRLHFLPLISPREMEIAGAAFDLGYVGETGETLNRDICLTNKTFSYLASGLPMVLSNTLAHRSLARELGGAARLFHSEDPSDLARVIDEFLCDSGDLAVARKTAYRLGADRFNWEIEGKKFVETVLNALG